MLKILLSIFFGFIRCGSLYTGKYSVKAIPGLLVFYVLLAAFSAGIYVVAKNTIDAYYYTASTQLYHQLKQNTAEAKPDTNDALVQSLYNLDDWRVFCTALSLGLLLGIFLSVAGNVWFTDITAVLRDKRSAAAVKQE